MKKIAVVLCIVLCLVAVFALSGCESVSVSRVYVNEEMHAIVEYTDGTTEDLGYVGVEVPVEVLPPVYTVTFKGEDGSVLDTQRVYKGLSAKAPTAPSVEDKDFDKWDKEFTDIQGDTVVTAVYKAKQSFTVTFKGKDGNVLKTESVIIGKSATAPTAPEVNGYIFTGWDKEFSNIQADTVVTAEYREKGSFVVTFKDHNGLTLSTANVKEGATATAPANPTREGYTFKGWSGSLVNITANKTVTATYELINGDNIFDISYTVTGDTVTMIVSLKGKVCVAGFQGELAFEGMTASKAVANSSNAIVNLKDGKVSVAYTSATNVTSSETVFTVTLKKTADNGKATLTLANCFDQEFKDVSYKVIGQNLKLK